MKRALIVGGAGLGLVVTFTGVQLSLITSWSVQQWVFAVVLPAIALIAQVAGGLALWTWFKGAGAPARGRYRARHAWQARRWLART